MRLLQSPWRNPLVWWMLCTLSLGALATAVRTRRLLPGELALAKVAQSFTDTPVHTAAQWLDVGLNDRRATVLFVAVAALIALRWGMRSAWLFGWAGLATSTAKVVDLVPRPRPGPDLAWGEYLHGYGGFPSGHVVYVTVLCATAIWLSTTRPRTTQPKTLVLSAGWALGWLAVLVIGPARVITNDHWPADVIAGYLLAVWFLSSGLLLLPALNGTYDRLSGLVGVSQAGERLRRVGERGRRRALQG